MKTEEFKVLVDELIDEKTSNARIREIALELTENNDTLESLNVSLTEKNNSLTESNESLIKTNTNLFNKLGISQTEPEAEAEESEEAEEPEKLSFDNLDFSN